MFRCRTIVCISEENDVRFKRQKMYYGWLQCKVRLWNEKLKKLFFESKGISFYNTNVFLKKQNIYNTLKTYKFQRAVNWNIFTHSIR